MTAGTITTVVLPTYNERATLPALLRELATLFPALRLEAVVVDDASPDNTAEAAAALDGVGGLGVRVLRRSGKLGLSSAVVAGAAVARGEVVVVMDADGSHPPQTIPALVAAVRTGADVAVGSRYVPGGRIVGWPWPRRVASRVATAAARALLRLEVRDPLSGFFAARREVLAGADYWALGFKILLEVLARHRALRVVEVPYTFVDRVAGRSKLDLHEVAAYLRLVHRLVRTSGPGAPPRRVTRPGEGGGP